MPFLTEFVPEEHREHVKAITIQQVVAAVKASGRHDDWIDDFRQKYGLV